MKSFTISSNIFQDKNIMADTLMYLNIDDTFSPVTQH